MGYGLGTAADGEFGVQADLLKDHFEPAAHHWMIDHAKSLYRIVSREDSQNRRAKSTREMRRRLIMLDYVLAHLGEEEFLDSELSRRTFFARLGMKPEILASAAEFGNLMPVTVRRTGDRPTVCFTFIDEGHRSTAKFERFLRTHDRLLCSLVDFAVIYVATTPRNFEHAQRLFERRLRSIQRAEAFGASDDVVHTLRVLEPFIHAL